MRNANAAKCVLINLHRIEKHLTYPDGSKIRVTGHESDHMVARKRPIKIALAVIAEIARETDSEVTTQSLLKWWGAPGEDSRSWITQEEGSAVLTLNFHATKLSVNITKELSDYNFEDKVYAEWERRHGAEDLCSYPWRISIYPNEFDEEDWQRLTQESQTKGKEKGKGK